MYRGGNQVYASPEEAVVHFGVKGMRWGVRNEEDTGGEQARASTPLKPLSEKQQRRVDKFMQRADVMDTQISALKVQNQGYGSSRNPAKQYARYANNQSIAQFEKSKKRALRDAEAVQKGKLTSTQKRAIVGGVAVAALIGGYAIYRGQQSGALNSYKLLTQARLRGQEVPFKVNKNLSKRMSAEELLHQIAKPVNPGYSTPGGHMNCRRSTYAFELRRRGFDVHATTSAHGWGQSESGVINALTTQGRDYFRATSMSQSVVTTGGSNIAKGDKRLIPGAKILLEGLENSQEQIQAQIKANTKRYIKTGKAVDLVGRQSSSAKVLEELAKHPNGARGEVVFKFPSFGHSMAWEIVDGVPHIFDSQKGTLYNASHLVESKWDGFSAAEIRRLDNVDLDLKFLTRWATNVPKEGSIIA